MIFLKGIFSQLLDTLVIGVRITVLLLIGLLLALFQEPKKIYF
jgi:hypothetical protein